MINKPFVRYTRLKNAANIDVVPERLLPHTEFDYPNEADLSMSEYDGKMQELLRLILIDMVKSKAPLSHIVSLCYVFRIGLSEVIDGPHTIRNLANYVGITESSFHENVKNIRKKYKSL